jgi:regulator of protease activity HflC (stomatin/prohibitin superfamily)
MSPKEKNKLVTFLVIVVVILSIVTNGAVLLLVAIVAGIYFYFKYKQGSTAFNPNINSYMTSVNFEETKKKFSRVSITIAVLVVVAVVVFNIVTIVPSGQTGVLHLFGKVNDTELSSGIHFINPLASVSFLSIRTEQYTMSIASMEGQHPGDDSIEALTKEGLKVALDMTVLYHLDEARASDVYRTIGLDYDEKIIRPEVRSAIREVIALYEAKDIYSEKREEAVGKIEEVLKKSLSPRGIELESVLLRNVQLPLMLAKGIEEKLTAEQEAQKYDFILQKEVKEAERKRIEAGGQREAQQIINESLTDRYVQYMYVQNLQNREGTIYVPYDMPMLKGI